MEGFVLNESFVQQYIYCSLIYYFLAPTNTWTKSPEKIQLRRYFIIIIILAVIISSSPHVK